MNKESKKLTWAVGLVAGLGVLSIAYAALSSTLNIKGENAEIKVGYVHFLGKDDLSSGQEQSKAFGIGSTNSEYLGKDNTTISGGIFNGRAEGKTGLITGDEIGADLTKALAEPGTFALWQTNKAKDTVTITGAKLNDYGSFIIYKLDIINESANPMRLKSEPTVEVTDVAASGSGTAASKSNIQTAIYTVCDDNNFSKPCGENLLTVAALDSSTGKVTEESKTLYNYLDAGANTTWYLRVGFDNYDAANNNVHGTTTFNFSVTPQWEAVIPKA